MSAVTTTETEQNEEAPRKKRGVPEGLWIPCDSCKSTVYRQQVEKNLFLCPECDHHFTVPGRVRIEQLLDESVAANAFVIESSGPGALVNLNDVGPEAGLAPGTQVRNGPNKENIGYSQEPYYLNAMLKVRNFRASGQWTQADCGSAGS